MTNSISLQAFDFYLSVKDCRSSSCKILSQFSLSSLWALSQLSRLSLSSFKLILHFIGPTEPRILCLVCSYSHPRLQWQRAGGVAWLADQLRGGHSPGHLHQARGKQEVSYYNSDLLLVNWPVYWPLIGQTSHVMCREMSVVKGDYLEVLNTDRKWWKVRNKSQEVIRDIEMKLSMNTGLWLVNTDHVTRILVSYWIILDRVCAVHHSPDVDSSGSQGVSEGASAAASHAFTWEITQETPETQVRIYGEIMQQYPGVIMHHASCLYSGPPHRHPGGSTGTHLLQGGAGQNKRGNTIVVLLHFDQLWTED